ncbi:Uncharacterized protein QTN25_010816 [Entamoeba marina]
MSIRDAKAQREHKKNSNSKHKDKKQVAHITGIAVIKAAESHVTGKNATERDRQHANTFFRMVYPERNQSIHKTADNKVIQAMEDKSRYTVTNDEEAHLRDMARHLFDTPVYKVIKAALSLAYNEKGDKVIDFRHKEFFFQRRVNTNSLLFI